MAGEPAGISGATLAVDAFLPAPVGLRLDTPTGSEPSFRLPPRHCGAPCEQSLPPQLVSGPRQAAGPYPRWCRHDLSETSDLTH